MSIRQAARIAWIFILLPLSSCVPAGEGARLELAVGTDNMQVIRFAQQVLYARLRDASGGGMSDVRTSYFADSNKLVFDIMHSSPGVDALRYLYGTRGEYRVFTTDDSGKEVDWITNQDIASTEGGRSMRDAKVFVGLRAGAARRVEEESADLIGSKIQASLDGDLIHESTVTWPLQRYYSFDVDSVEHAKLMAIVLRYPALPAEITEISAPKPL